MEKCHPIMPDKVLINSWSVQWIGDDFSFLSGIAFIFIPFIVIYFKIRRILKEQKNDQN